MALVTNGIRLWNRGGALRWEREDWLAGVPVAEHLVPIHFLLADKLPIAFPPEALLHLAPDDVGQDALEAGY